MAINVDTLEIEIGASSKEAVQELNKLDNTLKSIQNRLNGKWSNPLKNLKTSGDNTSNQDVKVRVDTKDIDRATKKVNAFSKTLSSLKRIAFYRLIRSAIKAVTDSFKEGVENVYQYSKAVGTDFAPSMDKIATSALYLKNALGSLAAPLIQTIAPAVDFVIDKFVDLINIINQVLAALSGRGTYTKAVKQTTEYAKATTEAAKAAKSFALGIDELNTINSDSGGGGGGGATTDYTKMFEEAPVNNVISDFVISIKNVFAEWKDFTPKNIASKVLAAVFGVAGAIIGWHFGGIGGAAIGLVVGASLGAIIGEVTFSNGTNMSETDMLKALIGVLGGIAGATIGFMVGGPAGAAIGLAVGVGVSLLVSKAIFKDEVKQSQQETAKWLITALGAVTGGLLGFTIGGPLGAFIGVIVGTAITHTIVSAIFEGGKYSLKIAALRSLVVALGAAVGGAIGFSMGGPLGAAIGATVGVLLTLQVTDVKWNTKFMKALPKLTLPAGALNGAFNIGSLIGKSLVTTWATGGYPTQGEMFIASEAGPELVGRIGNKTAVVNNDQIVRSVEGGVERANEGVIAAVDRLTQVVERKNTTVSIDGKTLTNTVERVQRERGASIMSGGVLA